MTPEGGADPRRLALLDAAFAVFVRYGYRKTSMDEVARAAHLSRQGLYLHFSSKDELFRATVEHALDTALAAATAGLRDGARPIGERLVHAFDEWVGRFAGMMKGDTADLVEAAGSLIGPLGPAYDKVFIDAVARAIASSGLTAAYKRAGITTRQLAETLHAAAR